MEQRRHGPDTPMWRISEPAGHVGQLLIDFSALAFREIVTSGALGREEAEDFWVEASAVAAESEDGSR